METKTILSAGQLADVNNLTRKLIFDHLAKKNLSLNQFAKQSGCQQNQLWLYLYSRESKKGLHSNTLEKIGKYIFENN